MNLSFTVPSNFRENLLLALIDMEATPNKFNAYLMRSGFSFNSTNHKYKKNFKTTTTDTISCTASTKTFTRGSGSFIDDGWVVNAYLTGNSTNAGTYVVRAVTDLTMRVDVVGAATFVDQSGTSQTLTCQDEMKAITTGALSITTEDDDDTFTRGSGSFITNGFEVGTIFTSSSATSPGPFIVTEVSALVMTALPYGNATAVADETASLTLTNGYTQGAVNTLTFDVSTSTLKLETDSFAWSSFGAALPGSPGIIIVAEDATGDPIVAYGRLTPWTITF